MRFTYTVCAAAAVYLQGCSNTKTTTTPAPVVQNKTEVVQEVTQNNVAPPAEDVNKPAVAPAAPKDEVKAAKDEVKAAKAQFDKVMEELKSSPHKDAPGMDEAEKELRKKRKAAVDQAIEQVLSKRPQAPRGPRNEIVDYEMVPLFADIMAEEEPKETRQLRRKLKTLEEKHAKLAAKKATTAKEMEANFLRLKALEDDIQTVRDKLFPVEANNRAREALKMNLAELKALMTTYEAKKTELETGLAKINKLISNLATDITNLEEKIASI
jgi:chromosome segregation ATPase